VIYKSLSVIQNETLSSFPKNIKRGDKVVLDNVQGCNLINNIQLGKTYEILYDENLFKKGEKVKVVEINIKVTTKHFTGFINANNLKLINKINRGK
jgi:hypothetical protein